MVHNNSAFWVAVDAEGYQAVVMNADAIVANRYLEVGLTPSGIDTVTTTYTFADWNTVQVTRTNVITVDNVSARMTADRKYGMGPVGLIVNDGSLSAGEIQAWADNLKEKGAEKRDTKQFLTLNNTFYKLNATTYAVTIEGADGSVAADATIFINSTYEYTLAAALDNPNSMKYTMGFNATYDTKYVDYTNHIILPMTPVKFEMTSNVTETNKVEVTGYNNPITINPMVHDGEMEQVTMTIQASMNGTAKAKILSGVHYVMNSTYDNYTVIVPRGPIAGMDTKVTFSAEDSTDKIGNINMANFTWTLGDGTTAYGMKVDHNYTNANVSGLVSVKLLITETGGNSTNRTINVWIDSQNPVAAISADVTDSENITFVGNTLTVMEDFPIVFSGVKFSDAEGMATQTIAGATSYDDIKSGDRKGLIEKWYWSWGEKNSFDETVTKDGSKNITHVYNTPGTYTLNMIATDVVGRESANATWTVKVIDITAPIPDFNIRNSAKALVTEVIENKTFTYNASTTTDNFDELANITFEWSFNVGGVITTYTEMTVNHTFTKVGMYNVTLKATDFAGNSENKTMLINVNLASRPNIIMKLGTMVFSSSPGTAGKAMTVSVNITNDGSENATGIQTKFYIRNADGTNKEIGTATTSFLGKGNTTTVSISWTPNKKGEYSIWANSTCAGEHSSQWWDNKIDDFTVQKVTVDEAPWVMPAIIVAIVVVIIVVFLGMRYFMKSGTKDDESGDKRKKR
jgi:PKD repeat protein